MISGLVLLISKHIIQLKDLSDSISPPKAYSFMPFELQ